MAYIYDMTDTWNAGGTTFTAIKMNVTDSASASGSLLLDLQVGGSSKFKVTKAGVATVSDGSKTAPSVTFAGDTTRGLYWRSGISLAVAGNSGRELSNWDISGNYNIAGNTFGMYGAGGGDLSVSGANVVLNAPAADTLELRRSTNAQTFNVYNTYTDASNYERGFFKYSSNILEIGHQAAGTGNADRTVRLVNGGVSRLEVTNGGNIKLGSNSSLEFAERTAPSAPGANGVYVYAQDNGAGKTQLMALFASGAAQQIAIQP